MARLPAPGYVRYPRSKKGSSHRNNFTMTVDRRDVVSALKNAERAMSWAVGERAAHLEDLEARGEFQFRFELRLIKAFEAIQRKALEKTGVVDGD